MWLGLGFGLGLELKVELGSNFRRGICPRTLYNKLFLFWRCSAKGVALKEPHMAAFAKSSSNSYIAYKHFVT